MTVEFLNATVRRMDVVIYALGMAGAVATVFAALWAIGPKEPPDDPPDWQD